VTYGWKQCTLRPTKEEVHRVRLTVGGDRLDYPGDASSQCASIITTKILLNSVISTPSAHFGTADITAFYYGTPMERYEYMRIKYDEIPQNIVDAYNLKPLVHDGHIYMEIRKGMPGLKQAGRLANERLVNHLAKYGYAPVAQTPSLWRHHTRLVAFTLVVDDFGIKYEGKQHFDHLISAISDLYDVTVDKTGTKYLGLTIKWDYKNGVCEISMPEYVETALHKFQHNRPRKRQDAPHPWIQPTYGSKIQYAPNDIKSPSLPATAKKRIQQIVGTFIYYAVALDFTMLVAIGSLASQTNNPTEQTMSELVWFLDYCASNPDTTIRFIRSDMHLWASSDASYLSAPQAKSRAGGYFFLSSKPTQTSRKTPKTPPLNGPIHTISKIIKAVMSSAMEAEVGATFINAREACPIRVALEELGHPQGPTPMEVDNSAAVGFANGTIKHKRSKAIDMRFHWVRDRVRQGQFHIYWIPGKQNEMADYLSKHHPTSHHRYIRQKVFQTQHLANIVVSLLLQGCDKSSPSPSRNPSRNPSQNPSWNFGRAYQSPSTNDNDRPLYPFTHKYVQTVETVCT